MNTINVATWRPHGDLTLSTISEQQQALKKFLANQALDKIVIDLSDVKRSDSAGLAFMIEAIRMSRSEHRTLSFQSIPEQIIIMMRFCHVWAFFKEEKWIN